MTKKTIRAKAVSAPASQGQAEAMLGHIGKLQRIVTKIEADMNDKLSLIKRQHEEKAGPLNEEIDSLFQALHMWAETNRHELLKGKTKTVRLSTGEISWRNTPPSVKFKRGVKVDAVIALLKRHKLNDFVRTKEEVNKDAILAEPERVVDIDVITIDNREEFVAKPFETEIERVEIVKKSAA